MRGTMSAVVESDRRLVEGWRAGEAACAAALFERHRAGMHAVAVSVLGAHRDIEDVVHDAFVVAITRLDTLRDPSAVGVWLRGITRNLSRQRIRILSSAPLTGLPAERLPAERDADPASVLESVAIREWVWTTLESLSPTLRLPLVLRYFSRANSYEAIAALLDVPIGTVRSRLNEGRRQLTRALTALADEAFADHRAQIHQRVMLFGGIYDQYNQGADCSLLHEALEPGAKLRVPDVGEIARGRDAIVRDIETDVAAGVRLTIVDLVAGRDVTIVEGVFQNPRDDPEHCPPMTTQVFCHRGDHIAFVTLHYGSAGGGPATATATI